MCDFPQLQEKSNIESVKSTLDYYSLSAVLTRVITLVVVICPWFNLPWWSFAEENCVSKTCLVFICPSLYKFHNLMTPDTGIVTFFILNMINQQIKSLITIMG